MADIIGNIKAYHNSADYNVADIYDEKDIGEKTVVLVHFDENGLIDECNNNWVYYSGNDTTQPVPTGDLNFYIGQSDTTAIAFSDTGLKQANFSAGYAMLEKEITLGGNEPFTIDGWVSSGVVR